MNISLKTLMAAASLGALLLTGACNKTESYTDLLKREQKASNWYLAQQRVCNELPADSVFETGPDAPFYKMDDDGYIYMQVIKVGDRKMPVYGDQVYFTYTRYNVLEMYEQNTLDVVGKGNQDNFLNSVGDTYFIYQNYGVAVSADYGQGMQLPLSWLGYDSEVNILLKSYYGFSTENTTCIPYLVNTRYFKAEY
ncbi:MAG: DUF4827 domain-containing protein [Muribaculaceae bacterium]|nr:DUF4827 domain-containing protein [Muribaculaceae bacterium]